MGNKIRTVTEKMIKILYIVFGNENDEKLLPEH